MNPYLEQTVFWSSFHSRFLVAIADMIRPQLRPRYCVEVETCTYLNDEGDELFVGVPDLLVLSPQKPAPEIETPETVVAKQKRPQQIQLPVTTEVREWYLWRCEKSVLMRLMRLLP